MALIPEKTALLERVVKKFKATWQNAISTGNDSQWMKGDIINRYLILAKRLDLDVPDSQIHTYIGKIMGESIGSIRSYAWVSKVFLKRSRNNDLSWSHYRSAAGVKDAENPESSERAKKWIQIAINEKLTVRQLKSRITEDEGKAKYYRGRGIECIVCSIDISMQSKLKLYKDDELIGDFCGHGCLAAYSSNAAIKK